MTLRPILFSGEMVRAILQGRKSQTRRVAKFKPREEAVNLRFSGLQAAYYFSDLPKSGWVLRCRDGNGAWNDRTWAIDCQHGLPGDQLWVRESFSAWFGGVPWRDCLPEARTFRNVSNVFYRATHNYPDDDQRWTPGIHMPRWASRLTLLVTMVRVERLQAISEEDAEAEGVDAIPSAPAALTHRTSFARLWDGLNAKRGYAWETNPWVWVVEFRQVQIGTEERNP